MADIDPVPTFPISHGGSRTHRAEDDIGGGGRTLAQVLSPAIAVVPWVMTIGGMWLSSRWVEHYQRTFEVPWGYIIGGGVVFVLAALVWAALTAWSSSGAVVAGICTLVFGFLLAVPEVNRQTITSLQDILGGPQVALYYVLTPTNFMLLGSLLLAAGLGAAGARRLRR